MPKFSSENMREMLRLRMGWNQSDPKDPFRDVRCYKLDEDQAVIFVLAEKQAYLLYDELPLYPSDALVTKVRLME